MMDNTHNWIFHKSGITGRYYAVKSTEYFLLKNDLSNPKVLSSSSMATLEELINKTDGDLKQIDLLLLKKQK